MTLRIILIYKRIEIWHETEVNFKDGFRYK